MTGDQVLTICRAGTQQNNTQNKITQQNNTLAPIDIAGFHGGETRRRFCFTEKIDTNASDADNTTIKV